jgi:hypothetical protein
VAEGKLVEFYRRTHPGGIGWRKIAARVPDVQGDAGFGRLFLNWGLGVIMVYSFLFGLGDLLFGSYLTGIGILALGLVSGAIIWRDLSRRGL